MPFAWNGSHRIHFRADGDRSAPPVLLVMGLGLSCEAWDALPRRLSRRFRVLTFDNRGVGLSSRATGGCSIAHLANDAASVLDAEAARAAAVFGISMGGLVAQELALRHPRRVRSLALGATFADARSMVWPALRDALDLLLLNCGDRFATPERVAGLLVSRDFARARPLRAREWLASDAGQARTPWPVLMQLAAVARHSSAARLRGIEAPTLVIAGDEDRVVPVENAYLLSRTIPGARLLVLRGAGHAFPLEREDETVNALEEHFLAPASVAC